VTALDTFWGAVRDEQRIPVAFPFATTTGGSGLAASSVSLDSAEAREMALSPDPRSRAVAAILATDYTMARFVAANEFVRLG